MDNSPDYAELIDQTAEWENPFVPAPLGDTVVMDMYSPQGRAPQARGEDAVP
jgi:hypothetical protein